VGSFSKKYFNIYTTHVRRSDMAGKYVVYAAGYTRENDCGIKIYDLDNKKGRLKYRDKCHIRKGCFPNSADGEENRRWVFVSLDMDLYRPMKAG
jgi:hypothetical protein